jgi:hypothetical protein
MEYGYGAACDDDYESTAGGLIGPELAPCIYGTRCKEDRCRSCETSDECGTQLPEGCYIKPGEPGQRCGNNVLDNDWTLVDDGPSGEGGGEP